MTAIKYLIAACVLALGVGSAKAEVVTFTVKGTIDLVIFEIPILEPLEGSFVLDRETGLVLNLDLESPRFEDELSIFFQRGNSFGYESFVPEPPDLPPSMLTQRLTLETSDDLVGFIGGDFTGVYELRRFGQFPVMGTTSRLPEGPSTQPPSPVPLPPAFQLFLSALAGLLGFGWFRKVPKIERCVTASSG